MIDFSEPEGARTPYAAGKKRANRRLVSSGKPEFVRSVRAIEIIQLSLANYRRFSKWIDRPCCKGSLIGSTREAGIGSGSE
jgi:hypothetical protein